MLSKLISERGKGVHLYEQTSDSRNFSNPGYARNTLSRSVSVLKASLWSCVRPTPYLSS